MRGSIHDCVVAIKSTGQSQLLLAHPEGGYQLIRAAEEAAKVIFEPWHKRHSDIVGVFNRRIPIREIYAEAGEPVPGEGR